MERVRELFQQKCEVYHYYVGLHNPLHSLEDTYIIIFTHISGTLNIPNRQQLVFILEKEISRTYAVTQLTIGILRYSIYSTGILL